MGKTLNLTYGQHVLASVSLVISRESAPRR